MPSLWNKLLSGYLGCGGAGEKSLPAERETEAPGPAGRKGGPAGPAWGVCGLRVSGGEQRTPGRAEEQVHSLATERIRICGEC